MQIWLKTIFFFSFLFIRIVYAQDLNHEDYIVKINPDWKKIREFKEKNKWNELIDFINIEVTNLNVTDKPLLYFILAQSYTETLKWQEANNEIQKIDNKIKSIQDVINLLKCKFYIATKSYNNAIDILNIITKNENKVFFTESLKSWICEYFKKHEIPVEFLTFVKDAEKLTPYFSNNYCISNIIKTIYAKQRKKIPAKIRKNLWIYPTSLEVINDSDKYLKDFDISISMSDYLEKYKHIYKLYKKRPWEYRELIEYLIQSIKQHKSGIKSPEIGLLYMQLLFEKNEFDEIIKSAKQDDFVLKYAVSHEYQLYYLIRARQRSTVRLYDQYGHLTKDIKKNILDVETRLNRLIKMDSRFKWLAKAISKMAETCYLVGMLDKANHWWNQLIQIYNNSNKYIERIEVDEAKWMKVFILIEQNKFGQAIEIMNNTLNRYICYDLENQARMRYWQGWLYKKLGKELKKERSWKILMKKYPNTFYGLNLANKEQNMYLRVHYNNNNNRILCSDCEQPSSYQESLLKEWKLLLMIGEKELVDYEIKEYFKLEKNRKIICDFHVKIFNLLNEYSLYNRSVKLINRYYLEKIVKVPINKHKSLWQCAYPLVHKKYINNEFINNLNESKKFLIHAIMRRESKFNPFSVSNAGAVGLLQLIIHTAREEAKQIDIVIDSTDELFDIKKNIQIGSAHIKRLLSQYKNIYQVIGAYNAGRPKMNEWIRNFKNDPEYLFIEKIPYRETRNYIKSTVKDFHVYNHIYGN